VKALRYASEHRGLVAQWFSVLAGPAAWSAQLFISYNLADTGSCAPASPHFLASGGYRPFIALTSGLAAAVTLLALVVSYRCWRRLRGNDPTTGNRASWLAIAGIMVNGLFLLMILGSFLPLAFISQCTPSPA